MQAGLRTHSQGPRRTPPLVPGTAEAAQLVARTWTTRPPAPGLEAAPIVHTEPGAPPGWRVYLGNPKTP